MNNIYNGKVDKGFTLIELAIVLAILGILAAIVIPQFVNLRLRAEEVAKESVVGRVQSALAITIAKQRGYPQLNELASHVQTSNGQANAVPSGVQVSIKGKDYTVKTYKDFQCSSPTSATSDLVKCVSGISVSNSDSDGESPGDDGSGGNDSGNGGSGGSGGFGGGGFIK